MSECLDRNRIHAASRPAVTLQKKRPRKKRRSADDFVVRSDGASSRSVSDAEYSAGGRADAVASDDDPSFEVIGGPSPFRSKPRQTVPETKGAHHQESAPGGPKPFKRQSKNKEKSIHKLKHKRRGLTKLVPQEVCCSPEPLRRLKKAATREVDEGMALEELGLDASAIQTGKRRRFAKCWDAAFDAGEAFDEDAAEASLPSALQGVATATQSTVMPGAHSEANPMPCVTKQRPAHCRKVAAGAVAQKAESPDDDDFDAQFGLGSTMPAGGAQPQARRLDDIGATVQRRLDKLDTAAADVFSDAEDADDWASDASDGAEAAVAMPAQRRTARPAAGGRLRAMLQAEHASSDGDEQHASPAGAATEAAPEQRTLKRKIVLKRPAPNPVVAPPAEAEEQRQPAAAGKRIRFKVRRAEAGLQAVPAEAGPEMDGCDVPRPRGSGEQWHAPLATTARHRLQTACTTAVVLRCRGAAAEAGMAAGGMLLASGGQTTAAEGRPRLTAGERQALPLLLAVLRASRQSALQFRPQESPSNAQDPDGLLDALQVWPLQLSCSCGVSPLLVSQVCSHSSPCDANMHNMTGVQEGMLACGIEADVPVTELPAVLQPVADEHAAAHVCSLLLCHQRCTCAVC